MARPDIISRVASLDPKLIQFLASVFALPADSRDNAVNAMGQAYIPTLLKLKLVIPVGQPVHTYNLTPAFVEYAKVASEQTGSSSTDIFTDETIAQTRSRVKRTLGQFFSPEEVQSKTGGNAGLTIIFNAIARSSSSKSPFWRTRRLTRSQLGQLTQAVIREVKIKNDSEKVFGDVDASVRTVIAVVFPKAI